MPIQVVMPQLGESVVEGTVTKWLKSPGEPVQEFEPLVEINTDKVDTEIPSTAAGTLLEILVPEGTTVQAGAVLALIGVPEDAQTAPAAPPQAPPQPEMELATTPAAKPAIAPREAGGDRAGERSRDLGFISPVVARIAQEHHIDLAQVKGTGLGGRITKRDVLAYLERRPPGEPALESQEVPLPPRLSPALEPEARPASAAPAPPISVASAAGDILPLTPVRKLIAEHMVQSKRTSPHVTTVMEADLSRVVAHRQANQQSYEQQGVHLTFTPYFIAAAVAAIQALPMANSSWSEAGILLHREINIGIATSLGEEGLIVPVIKDAGALSLLGLARAVNDLASRARAHKLQPDEVKGGTFTITNHGTSGSLFATPIIHQPQAAILGVGAIQKRVVVVEIPDLPGAGSQEAIAIRPMVYLTLTFDHRIMDGAMGDDFLGKVVEFLQNYRG